MTVSPAVRLRISTLTFDRSVYRSFHIDANRINARGRLEHMNQLERWRRDGIISIEMSEVAQTEAIAGASPQRASKARTHIYTKTLATTSQEQQRLRDIEKILFPNGVRSPGEQNDVEIVFNAIKYDEILVTDDGGSRRQPGGILGNREVLAKLGARILTDEEAVSLVRRLIEERDARIRRCCERDGTPVPAWVGND